MWLATAAILLFHLITALVAQYYNVPEAKLQAFSPKGFRVSIPDSQGVQLFAFHGNVNKPMRDLEAGQMSKDIVKSRNGRWVFEEPNLQLKLDDVIYYWLFVKVDGRGYTKIRKEWKVTSLEKIDNEGFLHAKPSTTSDYVIPDAILEAMCPRGLRVSIPDEPGVQLFAFHGNVNKPMNHLEAGTMSKDIIKSKNGSWIFEDQYLRLKNGDVVNYWLYVIRDGLGYRKDDQTWIVTGQCNNNTAEQTTSEPMNHHDTTNKPDKIVMPGESLGAQTDISMTGEFPQIDFKLPEGQELLVVVKNGKLLLKNPLPAGLTPQSDQTPVIGYCKSTHICLPVFIKP